MEQGFQITRPRLNVATKLMRELAHRARDEDRGCDAKQQGDGEAEAHLGGRPEIDLALKRGGWEIPANNRIG